MQENQQVIEPSVQQPPVQQPEQAPVQVQPEIPVQQQEKPKPPDLMARVANFMDDHKPSEHATEKDFHFDVNDIEKIEDPQAKEYIKNAYKSLEKGYQQKFQTLAELRKGLEETSTSQEWTVEKVQNLINDPSFVQVAQQVANAQSPQEEEYSALSETERSRIANLEQELLNLRKQNMDNQNLQQHAELQGKYPGIYDSEAIDTMKADLIAGKVRATNEHLFWASKGPDIARNSYEMGLKDGRDGNVDRSQSFSVEGQQAVSTPEPFVKEEGESSKSLWNRIAAAAVKSQKQNQQIRH